MKLMMKPYWKCDEFEHFTSNHLFCFVKESMMIHHDDESVDGME